MLHYYNEEGNENPDYVLIRADDCEDSDPNPKKLAVKKVRTDETNLKSRIENIDCSMNVDF